MDPDYPARVAVSEEEQKACFSIPAAYVNRFFVSNMGGVTRITFAEQDYTTGSLSMRTAVTMQAYDMVALARLLTDMAEPYLKAIEEVGGSNGQAQ